MNEKQKVLYAFESKEDKKALFFLLENLSPLPFPCTALSHPPVFLWDQRKREATSVHQKHSESGTLSCIQTLQQCVNLILNKIHHVKKKKEKKKGPRNP